MINLAELNSSVVNNGEHALVDESHVQRLVHDRLLLPTTSSAAASHRLYCSETSADQAAR